MFLTKNQFLYIRNAEDSGKIFMNGIVDVHLAEYGEGPGAVVEVPQVTTLLGAFSGFCSGYALMSTNTHGLRVAVSKRSDSAVHVYNSTKRERKKFQLMAIRPRKEDRWCTVVKSVCQMLQAAELPVAGFNLTFKGQSAVADPPALTAALSSGLILALDRLFGFHLEPNTAMRLAYNANRYSDVYQSRLRDLITIFSADPGKMIFFDLDSYDYAFIDYPFRKGSGVGSYFIDCSLPADELAVEVALFRQNASKAFGMLKSMMPKGSRMRSLTRKELVQSYPSIPEEYKRGIIFVLEDTAAALRGLDCLKAGDAAAMGKLLVEEQRNISQLAELTSPEVDWLVKRGAEMEAIRGVTEVSVGITGTLVVLIDDGSEDIYRKQLEEYERIFGFHPVMREYTPSGSIKVIPEDEYPLI